MRGVRVSWRPSGLPVSTVKPLVGALLGPLERCCRGRLAECLALLEPSGPEGRTPQPGVGSLSNSVGFPGSVSLTPDAVQVLMPTASMSGDWGATLLEQVGAVLAHLEDASNRSQPEARPAICTKVCSAEHTSQEHLDFLLTLSDLTLQWSRKPLHIDIPSVADGPPVADGPQAIPGRRLANPPSFGQLAPVLQLAGMARRRFRIRSPDGHPLCLFPGDRAGIQVAGWERDRPRRMPRGGSVFGPSCDNCAWKEACLGVSPTYAQRLGLKELVPPGVQEGDPSCESSPGGSRENPAWQNLVRLLLVNHPEERLFLGEILPPEQIPGWSCILPWTRLEVAADKAYGPCCADYLALRDEASGAVPLEALWNGSHMKAIRQALTRPGHPLSCRDWCPVLAAGNHRCQHMVLRGGTERVVNSQILLAEDLLAGTGEMRTPPLELCVAATAACNYRCVMCPYGEHPADADDQLPASFWTDLDPWLDRIMTLDVNGGEPFVSSHFVRFLESTDFARFPQLRLHTTTNGSFFSPRQLARLKHVPFHSLTVSINAASTNTYRAVHRRGSWNTLRRNLDALLDRRNATGFGGVIRYSFVVLKCNLHEIIPFMEMAQRDGVGVRFLLPVGNRKDQSVMNDPVSLHDTRGGLAQAREHLLARKAADDVRDLDGILAVVEGRLQEKQYRTL